MTSLQTSMKQSNGYFLVTGAVGVTYVAAAGAGRQCTGVLSGQRLPARPGIFRTCSAAIKADCRGQIIAPRTRALSLCLRHVHRSFRGRADRQSSDAVVRHSLHGPHSSAHAGARTSDSAGSTVNSGSNLRRGDWPRTARSCGSDRDNSARLPRCCQV